MSRWAALAAAALLRCAEPQAAFSEATLDLFANLDDDDRDGVRDGLDERINGPVDLDDLSVATLTVQGGPVQLDVEPPAAREHVRLFVARAKDAPTFSADAGPLAEGTWRVALEAKRPRSGLWDGRASVVARAGQRALARVDARVAPVVFPPSTARATQLHVVDVATNRGVVAALEAAAPTLVTHIDGAAYREERWAHDAVLFGVQRRGDASQVIALAMDRPTGPRGLEPYPATRLGPGVGLARPGRDEPSVMSFGGNVDVIPPHPGFPLGRLMVGAGEARHMGESTSAWLRAQEAQAPLLEVPTDWLVSGHVDEVVAFVPSAVAPLGWVAVVASPRAARRRLQDLVAQGHRARRLRTLPRPREAGDLVDDEALGRFNERAQATLDRLVKPLAALGEVVELPTLFEPGPAGLAQTAHPSLVNLVVLDRRVLTLSSDVDGDVFEPEVRTALERHGLTVTFIDDHGAYQPLGGGLHCAVAVERR